MRGIVKRFAQADQARCAKERRLGQPSKFRRDGWEAVVPLVASLAHARILVTDVGRKASLPHWCRIDR